MLLPMRMVDRGVHGGVVPASIAGKLALGDAHHAPAHAGGHAPMGGLTPSEGQFHVLGLLGVTLVSVDLRGKERERESVKMC